MGLFDFLKSKNKSAPKTLPPALPSGASWDDCPGAVELGRRHSEESQAWSRLILFGDWVPGTDDVREEPEIQTTRHDAELASAVYGMSDLGTNKFKTVYMQVKAESQERMSALISATRAEDVSWNEYPGAVSLAERHRQEADGPSRWHVTGEDPPEEMSTIEDDRRQEAAHKKELKSALEGMSEVDAIRFRTVYREVTTASVKRATAAMNAAMAVGNGEDGSTNSDVLRILHVELKKSISVDYSQTAKEIMTVFEDGRGVAAEHTQAIQTGLRNGRAMASSWKEEGQEELIRDISRSVMDWLDSIEDDSRDLCKTIYDLAEKKGMAEFFATRRQALVSSSSLNDSAFFDHQVESIKFLAGDLGKGTGHLLNSGKVRIPGGQRDFAMSAVANVEVASEESVKRVGGALGWGLAGAAVFGPAGFIVGGVLGGQEKDVTFVGTLKDGKRFMATAKSKVYAEFQAASFR